MADKNRAEKAVIKRARELEYPTDRLGPGSLLMQQSHVNSSRVVMANSQFTQFVSIDSPEMPLVPTGFENVLSQYSSMLDTTEDEYEIVAKFRKNRYNYVLIGFDRKHRRYHAWRRQEMEEHYEGFGTRYDNKYIDSLEIGDRVPSGTRIKKSTNFDKYDNYCYGKNVNVVFLVSSKVYEDGIYAMNGVDKMFNTYRCYSIPVVVGENEALLDLYGDDDGPRGIPRVGEKVKDYVAVVRPGEHGGRERSMKRRYLTRNDIDFRKDHLVHGNGRVIDIDVYTNKEPDKIASDDCNREIAEAYMRQQDFHRKLHRYMQDIVDTADADPNDCERLAKDASRNGHCYTVEFSNICAEEYRFVNAAAFNGDDDKDTLYGTTKVIVHLMDEDTMLVGSKFVGRSGNKGVISAKVIPPDKWWHMEDGRPIHMVFASQGIVGRANNTPLNEHHINGTSNVAIKAMKKTTDVTLKAKIVYDELCIYNPDEARPWRSWFKSLSHDEKVKECRRIERDGVVVVQDPIDNANILDFARADEKFPPDYQRIVFEDGYKSFFRVECAKLFLIRLKQDPFEKYSARSRGPVNPLTMLPAKSSMKKQGLSYVSDTAVRFGEIEFEMLNAMINHPAAIAQFMDENSTSFPAKLELSEHLYRGDDADGELSITDVHVEGKKNSELIQAYATMKGARIIIKTEEAPDGEFFED